VTNLAVRQKTRFDPKQTIGNMRASEDVDWSMAPPGTAFSCYETFFADHPAPVAPLLSSRPYE